VVTSIFVNPLQFGANEDYGEYPRTFQADAELLNAAGINIIFAPTVDSIYPDGQENKTCVSVPTLSGILCGNNRPGHFDGVATIVAKLLNIVQPNDAYFGEKDWQQLTLLATMTRQLNIPVKIVGVPIVRDSDGLALSSRNQYLKEAERGIAPILYQTLIDIRDAIQDGTRNFHSLEQAGSVALNRAGFRAEYLAVRDSRTLLPPDTRPAPLRILAAARLGKTRLIDNIGVKVAGSLGSS
jgi:pantoate--beta-alanine ligase